MCITFWPVCFGLQGQNDGQTEKQWTEKNDGQNSRSKLVFSKMHCITRLLFGQRAQGHRPTNRGMARFSQGARAAKRRLQRCLTRCVPRVPPASTKVFEGPSSLKPNQNLNLIKHHFPCTIDPCRTRYAYSTVALSLRFWLLIRSRANKAQVASCTVTVIYATPSVV